MSSDDERAAAQAEDDAAAFRLSDVPLSPENALAAAGARTVHVPLGDRAYDVHIGRGLVERAGPLLAPFSPRRRAVIVTDQSVAWRHLETLWRGLSTTAFEADAITLAPGEGSKSFKTLEEVLERMLELRLERDDLVIAFGGGVIGDLAGFASAILRRGVRFAQIPTTLLAQVDSSVGGKTGINTGHGKNLVGAFHQPSVVLADIDVLSTLPARELQAGYAEVLKYGLLGDAAFFDWLESNGVSALAGDPDALAYAVETSISAKARVVADDETEQGDRALLNLGHTFGHALEAATGFSGRLLHGEAVAIGMGLAFKLSVRLGVCPASAADAVDAHLARLGLKRRLFDVGGELPDADALMALMAQDKKVRDGRATFILVRDIGQAFQSRDVEPDTVRRLLAEELFARAQA